MSLIRIDRIARRCCLPAALAAAFVAWASGAVRADDHTLRLTAFAVNMSNVGRARAQTVDIVIDRWSTAEEREMLRSALIEQGSDALLRALQKTRRVGYIRTPDSLGYDLRFAHEVTRSDGGRRIIIATDRPIGFWEARNRPRTIDYPFTLIEIRLGPEGKGEGKLAIATKITYDKRDNQVVLENYASEPVRLQEVRVRG